MKNKKRNKLILEMAYDCKVLQGLRDGHFDQQLGVIEIVGSLTNEDTVTIRGNVYIYFRSIGYGEERCVYLDIPKEYLDDWKKYLFLLALTKE